MIDGSEKRNRQLAFELQNSHVCEKRSKETQTTLNQRFFQVVISLLIFLKYSLRQLQSHSIKSQMYYKRIFNNIEFSKL